jgi:hypothetical protein
MPAICCMAAVLLVPSSATAGGWWSSIRLDRARVTVGEKMKAEAGPIFSSTEAAEAARDARGKDASYAYLLRGFDYSIVDGAQREADPKNWWSVGGAEVYFAGRVTVNGLDLNLARATASFRVPKAPPGKYAVMFCDAECVHPLADLIPSHPSALTITSGRATSMSRVLSAGLLAARRILQATVGFLRASDASPSEGWLGSPDGSLRLEIR